MNVSMPPFSDLRDVGRMLRDTRESMGISLEEVAAQLKVRFKYLTSLEMGEIGDIPGEVYMRGYLKLYAEYLGYDGNQIIHQLQAVPATTSSQYLPAERSGEYSNTTLLVLLASILALLAIMLWQMQSDRQEQPVNLVQPSPGSAENFLSLASPESMTTAFPELCQTSGERLLPESVCRGDTLLSNDLPKEETSVSTIMDLQRGYPILPGRM
jgi:cytoskeletal protein RodZ